MAVLKWCEVVTWANLFEAADFNALANGSGVFSTTNTTGVIDNTTDLATHADVSFMLQTGTMSPSSGGRLEIYALPVMHDGTTYADGEAGSTIANQPVANYLWCVLPFRAKATQVQNAGAQKVPLTWSKAKLYCLNRSGVALPSSATQMTLKFSKWSLQSA